MNISWLGSLAALIKLVSIGNGISDYFNDIRLLCYVFNDDVICFAEVFQCNYGTIFKILAIQTCDRNLGSDLLDVFI
jgi:hypothetical protein